MTLFDVFTIIIDGEPLDDHLEPRPILFTSRKDAQAYVDSELGGEGKVQKYKPPEQPAAAKTTPPEQEER